jgi:hypothetical protein
MLVLGAGELAIFIILMNALRKLKALNKRTEEVQPDPNTLRGGASGSPTNREVSILGDRQPNKQRV